MGRWVKGGEEGGGKVSEGEKREEGRRGRRGGG